MNIPKELSLILLPNDVLLPGGVMKIPVATSNNLQIIKDVISTEENQIIGVLPYTCKTDVVEGAIGVAAAVIDMTSVACSVLGLSRIKIEKILSHDEQNPVASVSLIHDKFLESEVIEDTRRLMDDFRYQITNIFSNLEALHYFATFNRYKKLFGNNLPKGILIDICASLVANSYQEKLDFLHTLHPVDRMKKLNPMVARYLKNGGASKGLSSVLSLTLNDDSMKDRLPIRFNLFGSPHSFILKNMKRHNPLQPPPPDEDDELEEKLKALNLPESAAKVVNRELSQLKRLSRHHTDYAVHRNYLELISELPWNSRSTETINITKSKQDLEEDHHGMEKVKTRVLEFLAVRQLKSDLKGPILCFVGAPGVGKTSVAHSIASSLGRKFHRISLGGVCHHSDIRGHRKTYVGAMAGRIIQAIRSVGVKNPVILLDEIDKLGMSMNGDPASALLEVLDSEQNSSFVDHYLNIPFDLSEIIFIATANETKTIHPALKDRLEMIEMPGYTLEEKKAIAVKHLLPKQLKEHGLPQLAISLSDDILSLLITGYTREAGVRSLERKLAALCRRAAINTACLTSENLLKNDNSPVLVVSRDLLEDILGPMKYEEGLIGWREDVPGVVVGLCWTPVGGDVMLIEATKVSGGTNTLVLTGQLGSVMKESAKLAFNWFKSITYKYGLDDYLDEIAEASDVHIHFPAGAVSKEGPSAGITIAVAVVSLFSGIPVSPDLAFTGELTLTGSVLPVGGVKEKLIVAYNNGIKTVVIPWKNRKNLMDIPHNVLENLEVILVKDMDEVIKAAFNGQIVLRKGNVLTSKL